MIDHGNVLKNEIATTTTQITNINSDIRATQRIIDSLNEHLTKVGSQKDTADIEAGITEAQSARRELESQKEELASRAEVYKAVGGLLKDSGIKTLIVKQYLPIITRLVNRFPIRWIYVLESTTDRLNTNITTDEVFVTRREELGLSLSHVIESSALDLPNAGASKACETSK